MRSVGPTAPPGEVVVITGPAAAGKTTAARLLAEKSPEPSVHVHGDDFFTALKTGRRRGWETGAGPQHRVVFDAMGAAAGAYAAGGYLVVVDTLVRPAFIDILLTAIRRRAAATHLVVLRPDLDTVIRRSHGRDPAARHDDDVLRWLYDHFEDLSGLEVHVIDTTHHQPTDTVAAITAALHDGTARTAPVSDR